MVYSLLGIIIIALCVKIYLMKKSAREISKEFADRLQTDTNTLIGISSNDKHMCKLADSINRQLKILRREHLRYTQGDTELKNAITNISHDLRTPLTAICGYLDMMKKTNDPEKTERYLAIMTERTELMKQLTEELFRYSVIISEDDTGEMEEVFINQVLAESISSFYPVLTNKGIIPQIQMTDKHIVRTVNKSNLSRVFSNLLNNAVKYSDGDLTITLSDAGEIKFANTAKELSSVQVEQLFDRFYTVEAARNSTGLGLSIARTLVERMGGKIYAEYDNNILSITISLLN
ncbi:MAG: sensor histidine kinase [Ruminococcus sp.]